MGSFSSFHSIGVFLAFIIIIGVRWLYQNNNGSGVRIQVKPKPNTVLLSSLEGLRLERKSPASSFEGSRLEGPRLEKIGPAGVYLPFPGFSTVASVINHNEKNKLFKTLHMRLNDSPIVTKYFALLPLDSYHITIINIETKTGKSEEGWKFWFQNQVDRLMDAHSLFEEKSRDFNFRIASVDGSSTTPRLTLFAAVDTESEITLKGVVDSVGYLKHVPVQGFHITLGYQYNPYENYTVFPMIKQAVVAALVGAFGESYQTIIFSANKPKVCYFPDMKEFIPLDNYASFKNKLSNKKLHIKVDDFGSKN